MANAVKSMSLTPASNVLVSNVESLKSARVNFVELKSVSTKLALRKVDPSNDDRARVTSLKVDALNFAPSNSHEVQAQLINVAPLKFAP